MEKHLNLVVPVYHSSTMVHVAEKYFVCSCVTPTTASCSCIYTSRTCVINSDLPAKLYSFALCKPTSLYRRLRIL